MAESRQLSTESLSSSSWHIKPNLALLGPAPPLEPDHHSGAIAFATTAKSTIIRTWSGGLVVFAAGSQAIGEAGDLDRPTPSGLAVRRSAQRSSDPRSVLEDLDGRPGVVVDRVKPRPFYVCLDKHDPLCI